MFTRVYLHRKTLKCLDSESEKNVEKLTKSKVIIFYNTLITFGVPCICKILFLFEEKNILLVFATAWRNKRQEEGIFPLRIVIYSSIHPVNDIILFSHKMKIVFDGFEKATLKYVHCMGNL